MKKMLWIALLFAAPLLLGGDRAEMQTLTYYISTLRPDAAVPALKGLAEKSGGFVVSMNNATVTLRVPLAKLAEARVEITKLGMVTDLEEYKEDLTALIIEQKARIAVKEEYLKKIEAILATTGVQDTLEMERALSQAVTDLEALKGQLRMDEHDAMNALITVYVNPQNNGIRPKNQRWSRWGFVNTLGIQPLTTAGEAAR
ncbi:MAG TPA: DUF4349 domain-containing protein [bacterium]|nr:DUF4349 domain-containing protein [bacterium]